jgi:membrane associated rhomboid family serine protease
VGAQAIWVFITWLFWVVGASIVNKTISSLVDEKACGSMAYCAQIRGLFGAFLLPCPLRFLCEMKASVMLTTTLRFGCVAAIAVIEGE